MSFVSVPFILFLVTLFVLYYVIPLKWQWILLLLASYLFYVSGGIWMLAFILFTTLTVFYAALLLNKISERQHLELQAGNTDRTAVKRKYKTQQRRILTIAILLNFGLLFYFKYQNGIRTALQGCFSGAMNIPNLILPIGISFYMFQAVGYLFDVYRNKTKADTNIFKFALFVSFFPQILQGPISRHAQLAHQLYEGHVFSYQHLKNGALRIMWGFFKKLVIADRALIAVNTILGNYNKYAGFEIFFGVILFMLQIYTDFSGGIDITIGIAECLGITLNENFCRPHFASSVEDYWRRWHITLGAWMKEYVFYPLALSKPFHRLGKQARKFLGNYTGKLFPTCLAMLITFLCVGVWHGADFKYIAFGLYNGFWIILGILLTSKLQIFNEKKLHINTKTKSWKCIKIMLTMFIIMISKVFGVAPDFSASIQIIRRMFLKFNPWIFVDGSLTTYGLNTANLILLLFATMLLFWVSIQQEKGIHLREALARQNMGVRWILYFCFLFSILVFGVYGTDYDSTSFFYMQY